MPDEAHARKWVLLATHAFEADPLEEHYAGLLAAAVRATALRLDGYEVTIMLSKGRRSLG
jgi:hypothetical protein